MMDKKFCQSCGMPLTEHVLGTNANEQYYPGGITSYDLKKLPEMLAYYESKGCDIKEFIWIK